MLIINNKILLIINLKTKYRILYKLRHIDIVDQYTTI